MEGKADGFSYSLYCAHSKKSIIKNHRTIFFFTFQFPISAIPCLITLIVSATISSRVSLIKKSFLRADIAAQGPNPTIDCTNHARDRILQNIFPFAGKFARSVMGLISLYVSCK